MQAPWNTNMNCATFPLLPHPMSHEAFIIFLEWFLQFLFLPQKIKNILWQYIVSKIHVNSSIDKVFIVEKTTPRVINMQLSSPKSELKP
jgi:hypothetical protein